MSPSSGTACASLTSWSCRTRPAPCSAGKSTAGTCLAACCSCALFPFVALQAALVEDGSAEVEGAIAMAASRCVGEKRVFERLLPLRRIVYEAPGWWPEVVRMICPYLTQQPQHTYAYTLVPSLLSTKLLSFFHVQSRLVQ